MTMVGISNGFLCNVRFLKIAISNAVSSLKTQSKGNVGKRNKKEKEKEKKSLKIEGIIHQRTRHE